MHFEYYQNFVAIIDCGTISAASRKLHITQPALSNQIKALEDKYGTQLVIRGPRKLSLTQAGQVLYENARRMCVIEETTTQDIRAQLMGYRGTLKIGSIGMQPEKLSASLFLSFHECYPDVSYRIFESSSTEVKRMLLDGTVEVGILRSADPLPPPLTSIYSVPSQYVVCFSKENVRFNGHDSSISIKDLDGVPISIAGGIYRRFVEACTEADIKPNIISVCTSVAMTKIWAQSPTTVSVFSTPTFEHEEGLCCRRISGKGLETVHHVCYNTERARSAVLDAFIEYCQDNL